MTNHSPADDLFRIEAQERLLRFARFDEATAFELGVRIKQLAEQQHLSLTIEIRLARETVFFYAMPGTAPDNADWARRKRNTVELLHRSSYGVGLTDLAQGENTLDKRGLPLRDYATHGGSFPLWVKGVGMVGCVTVSGAPQRQDHALVVEALAALLEMPYSSFAL